MVSSPKRAPRLGERFKVVFAPEKPTSAVSAQYLYSFESRIGSVVQGAFVLVAAVAVLLHTVVS
ncbi:hypothetical protein [Streptomyces enissocaesilis]